MNNQQVMLHNNNDINVSTADLVLSPDKMNSMFNLAKFMASGSFSIPKELKGNEADCLAVVMQAVQWKLNPFTVAQKTYFIQGRISYESQLVNSAIISMSPTKNRINYEWFGDWSKVIGNFIEKTSQKGNKYIAPNWNIEDEKGLGIKVWATLKGEDKPRVLELLLSQATVRNSTLWASDPKQQLAYLAIRRWASLHTPDVLQGVYTPDELPNDNVNLQQSQPATQTNTQNAYLKEIEEDEQKDSIHQHEEDLDSNFNVKALLETMREYGIETKESMRSFSDFHKINSKDSETFKHILEDFDGHFQDWQNALLANEVELI